MRFWLVHQYVAKEGSVPQFRGLAWRPWHKIQQLFENPVQPRRDIVRNPNSNCAKGSPSLAACLIRSRMLSAPTRGIVLDAYRWQTIRRGVVYAGSLFSDFLANQGGRQSLSAGATLHGL